MEQIIHHEILDLFRRWAGDSPEEIVLLPVTASNRVYCRIFFQGDTMIAAWNDNPAENDAFIYLSGHFARLGLPVPTVHAVSPSRKAYLQTDLGKLSLFDVIQSKKNEGILDVAFWSTTYKQVIKDLIRFQISGHQGLDYNHCYPSPRFSSREIHWDLNYFKYYFLKLAGVSFHETKLQDGFDVLEKYLTQVPADAFMYRDFQARNIMVGKGGDFSYIDFQGGRQGPLPYDLASLLYNTGARIPQDIREELLSEYMNQVQDHLPIDTTAFREAYHTFALLRVLQSMGAYGYRGYFERKPAFLAGIPVGQQNLRWLLDHAALPVGGELQRVLHEVANSEKLSTLAKAPLELNIASFSYKRGIPADLSGHGGGFVFDCRILPNPGRIKEYQSLTGQDAAVIQYLEVQPEVTAFLQQVKQMTAQAVQNYLTRGHTHLSILFGCTGGQHRSVYCAEQIAAFLRDTTTVSLKLSHFEIKP